MPFEETLRRYATKPQAAEYGFAEMSDWYRPLDPQPGGVEQIIPAEMSLDGTVSKVMADAGLHDPAEPLNRPDFAAKRAADEQTCSAAGGSPVGSFRCYKVPSRSR